MNLNNIVEDIKYIQISTYQTHILFSLKNDDIIIEYYLSINLSLNQISEFLNSKKYEHFSVSNLTPVDLKIHSRNPRNNEINEDCKYFGGECYCESLPNDAKEIYNDFLQNHKEDEIFEYLIKKYKLLSSNMDIKDPSETFLDQLIFIDDL